MKLTFPVYHLFQILKRFENQHLPLDLFLRQYFKANKALGSKDRQFVYEAAYGMIRWRSLLDYLAGNNPTWEKRFTIFQGFQPNNYLFANAIPLPIRVSAPDPLFSLLEQDYGQAMATTLCQVFNTFAPITARVNPLKITREALLARLAPHFEVSPCSQSPLGIQFKKRIPFMALQEYKEGLFDIQDEASQIVASLVKANPGEQVLDYCAGGGGKTLAFAYQMKNRGQIYLHDIRPFILQQARIRIKRAGIQNIQFLESDHSQLNKLKKRMDWVLVDVPCTGTGALRRHPDQKWHFSLEQLNQYVGKQRIIFERALSFLQPKGKIVYATCSILKEENEKQVERFLKLYNLELVESPFISLPSYGGMDGFFAAVMQPLSSSS
ncbi:MAG: RsmB/NOP family class I SAM-dependent RNA methyltransferase [Chlamydiales bacterium]